MSVVFYDVGAGLLSLAASSWHDADWECAGDRWSIEFLTELLSL